MNRQKIIEAILANPYFKVRILLEMVPFNTLLMFAQYIGIDTDAILAEDWKEKL